MKKTDIEIALSQDLEPITDIAAKVELKPDEIYLYGDHIAKIKLSAREGREATARTVLVTAMTPTRAGWRGCHAPGHRAARAPSTPWM